MTDNSNKKSKTTNFYNFLKTAFFFLIVLQFAPAVISNFTETIKESIKPKAHVGYLNIKGMISDSSFYAKRIEEFEKEFGLSLEETFPLQLEKLFKLGLIEKGNGRIFLSGKGLFFHDEVAKQFFAKE